MSSDVLKRPSAIDLYKAYLGKQYGDDSEIVYVRGVRFHSNAVFHELLDRIKRQWGRNGGNLEYTPTSALLSYYDLLTSKRDLLYLPTYHYKPIIEELKRRTFDSARSNPLYHEMANRFLNRDPELTLISSDGASTKQPQENAQMLTTTNDAIRTKMEFSFDHFQEQVLKPYLIDQLEYTYKEMTDLCSEIEIFSEDHGEVVRVLVEKGHSAKTYEVMLFVFYPDKHKWELVIDTINNE